MNLAIIPDESAKSFETRRIPLVGVPWQLSGYPCKGTSLLGRVQVSTQMPD
jgi:hypothetical protein